MKSAVILITLSLTVIGIAKALVIQTPPADPSFSPSDFRAYTDHHKGPCTHATYRCLADHLMFLQCGAILVEKMARKEGESPRWYAYSMHSGPKVSFSVAGYFILQWFDPSVPATWSSGEQFDPFAEFPGPTDAVIIDQRLAARDNQGLANFVQQTLNWLDSQDGSITDACELRAFWVELRANSFSPPRENTDSDDRSNLPSAIE